MQALGWNTLDTIGITSTILLQSSECWSNNPPLALCLFGYPRCETQHGFILISQCCCLFPLFIFYWDYKFHAIIPGPQSKDLLSKPNGLIFILQPKWYPNRDSSKNTTEKCNGEHLPEGLVRSYEVKTFVLSISDRSASGLDYSDSNAILKTLKKRSITKLV